MTNKETYQRKLEKKLDEWALEVDRLSAKAEVAEVNAKIELSNQLNDLKEQQAKVRDNLEKLKSSSDDAWDDLMLGAQKASQVFETSLKNAASRFD
jgi:flagellar hook-basal body complex protein FliE